MEGKALKTGMGEESDEEKGIISLFFLMLLNILYDLIIYLSIRSIF